MRILFDIFGYVLCVVVGIIFYYLGKKEKMPVFLYSNLSIIGNEHSILGEDISISYKDTLVSNLSKTNITIRNIGREAIRGTDISTSDILKISFSEKVKILSAKIKKTTRDAIQFKILKIKDNVLEFSFDLLDKNDGALIEIIYDGSPVQYPIITGTIIGAPQGFKNPDKKLMNSNKYNLLQPFAMIAVSVLLLIGFNITSTKMETTTFPIAPSVADSVLGKELIKKASSGDREAVREIRKLSGLDTTTPIDWVESILRAFLFIIIVLQSINIIFLLRKRRYSNLMIEV